MVILCEDSFYLLLPFFCHQLVQYRAGYRCLCLTPTYRFAFCFFDPAFFCKVLPFEDTNDHRRIWSIDSDEASKWFETISFCLQGLSLEWSSKRWITSHSNSVLGANTKEKRRRKTNAVESSLAILPFLDRTSCWLHLLSYPNKNDGLCPCQSTHNSHFATHLPDTKTAREEIAFFPSLHLSIVDLDLPVHCFFLDVFSPIPVHTSLVVGKILVVYAAPSLQPRQIWPTALTVNTRMSFIFYSELKICFVCQWKVSIFWW